MCGICGILSFDDAPIDRATLAAMCGTLAHRGPDDQGEHVGSGIALGMRRLSIIDLETGRQPIWNERRDICIVFNGEIYNYAELRGRLIAGGHQFQTRTDTEVIVHLYEDFGDDCVTHLDGMFAFAIWDSRQQKLLLARDRLGEKPLLYYRDQHQLVFGSELKAVAAAGIPRDIDLDAVYHYFTLMSVPAPLTIFKGVRKLMPGHLLTCDRRGETTIRQYWDVTRWTTASESEEERLVELNARIEKAVSQRLVADVPVGALLSGGVDSSLVVAVMSRVTEEPVQTFSVGFEGDEKGNELPYAKRVARSLGTVHHELIVKPDVSGMLPRLAWHAGEPFAVTSAIPTYYVSKMAREHVKVVLTGDGGDELFAGYPRYRWDRFSDRLGILGPLAGRVLAPPLQLIAGFDPRFRRPAKHARSLQMGPDERYTFYLSKIDARDKRTLLTPDLLREFARRGLSDTGVLDAAYASFNGEDPLSRRLYGDLKASLADEMLTKVDTMSMAASLEARPPLLDHHLVEFAATLPSADKLRGRSAKYLLRRAAVPLLPPEIPGRPKHGFDVPVGSWLRGAIKSFAEELLFSPEAASRGIWRPAAVRSLWDRHQAGEEGLAERLWVLVNWELWCQVVYDAPARRDTAA